MERLTRVGLPRDPGAEPWPPPCTQTENMGGLPGEGGSSGDMLTWAGAEPEPSHIPASLRQADPCTLSLTLPAEIILGPGLPHS